MEYVYYVDESDTPTGETSEKYTAHYSDTKLHAAFSCYIFNEEGKFLVTQRADSKKVWPGVWTNSCCGHPAPDESREDAINRRVQYELGMKVKNIRQIIPDYIYKTPPYNGIIEHEYCPVYVAIADSDIEPNPDEVMDHAWMDWSEYMQRLESDSDDYSVFSENVPAEITDDMPRWSWWCKDQLKHLKDNQAFSDFIEDIIS